MQPLVCLVQLERVFLIPGFYKLLGLNYVIKPYNATQEMFHFKCVPFSGKECQKYSLFLVLIVTSKFVKCSSVPTEVSQENICLPKSLLMNQGFFFPWIDGGMKRWSEWAIVLLLQTGHSKRIPREQSFFKVASYSAHYLRVCAHVVLWVSITFSQADISPHTGKKKLAKRECLYVCVSVCWLGQVPEVPRKSPRSDGGSAAVGYERSLCSSRLGTRAERIHVRRMKRMTMLLLFCAEWMTLEKEMLLSSEDTHTIKCRHNSLKLNKSQF